MQHIRSAGYSLIMVLLLALLAACGAGTPGTTTESGSDADGITVRDPWVRAMVAGGDAEMDAGEGAMSDDMGTMDHGGSTSAAYMTLVNGSATADALISAATDAAEVVELHTVIMEENVMRMRPVEQIEVPANGETELRPGGFHIMLIGLQRDLNAGDGVELTLTFENAGEVTVSAPVQMAPGMNMDTMEEGGQ
ncbi:MAG: copper chaperone PCu(A)C [Chloroflexaceae bacterium]